MKKFQIIVILLAVIISFCCKNTEEQEILTNQVATTDTLASEKSNELYETVFREISEVPQLKDYEKQGGSVIEPSDSLGNYKYAIGQFSNDKNFIIALEEIIKERSNPKSKFKILDTINIPQLNPDEIIVYSNCRLNKIHDSKIIAIVKSHSSDDVEFYNHILKAWRVDTKTQKIVSVEDVKGIDCINEGYGL